MTNPITPSPGLIDQLKNDALHGSRGQYDYESRLVMAGYVAGANQELEACVNYIDNNMSGNKAREFRAIRRPQPPSLKEQALTALQEAAEMADDCPPQGICSDQIDTIRRALEALDD